VESEIVEREEKSPTLSIKALCFSLIVGTSLLRVYRIPLYGFNITPFRVVYCCWLMVLIKDVAFGKLKFRSSYALYLIIAGSILALALVDLLRMENLDRFGRDTAEHLANISLVGLLVVYTRTENDLDLFINNYVSWSALALLIAGFVAITGQVPFESLLRQNRIEHLSGVEFIVENKGLIRNASCFYDPSFYGLYLCFVATFSLYVMYFAQRRTLAFGILLLLNIFALFLSTSRSGLIGLGVVLTVSSAMIQESRKFILTTLLLMVAMAPVILWATGTQLSDSDFMDQLISSESTYSRLDLISNGYEVFLRHPFVGGGTEGILGPDVLNPSAHIVYLSILAKFGLLGFAIYGVFIFYPLAYVLSKGRNLARRYRFLILAIYLPLLVMYLLYDYFSFLEFQYLVFGIVYSIILNRFGLSQASIASDNLVPKPIGQRIP
jgi:hypothetical protein